MRSARALQAHAMIDVAQGAADWVQAQAAMRANDLAAEALRVAWVSAVVNALVVVAAFVTPWWQLRLQRRAAALEQIAAARADAIAADAALDCAITLLPRVRAEVQALRSNQQPPRSRRPVRSAGSIQAVTYVEHRMEVGAEVDGFREPFLVDAHRLAHLAQDLELDLVRIRARADRLGDDEREQIAIALSVRAGEIGRYAGRVAFLLSSFTTHNRLRSFPSTRRWERRWKTLMTAA